MRGQRKAIPLQGPGPLLKREHQAESGPTGFLKTPCSSSRLLDLNAVFSEQAKTIPHMTQTGPRH